MLSEFNFEAFKEQAKKYKMMSVQTTKRGDLPPVTMAEKNGKIVAIVVARNVDKHEGLHAARLLRIGFDADAICMVMDAHMANAKPSREGMTEEEMNEEMRKKFPPGSMQKACDEEGACAKGEIVDVMLCHRVDRNGGIKMFVLPYDYHGKDGPEFKWLEDHPLMNSFNEAMESKDDAKLSGFIPDSLREIMAEKFVMDDDRIGDILGLAAKQMNISKEHQQWHIGRAMLRILNSQRYMVWDGSEPPATLGYVPEPILPEGVFNMANLLPDGMIEEVTKVVKRTAKNPKEMQAALLALFKPHEKMIAEKSKGYGVDVTAEELAEAIAANIGEMLTGDL